MKLSIAFLIRGNMSGKFRFRSEVQTHFQDQFEPNFLETEGPGTGIGVVKRAVLQGSRIIIAVGGDGTVNEAVNGIQLAVAEGAEPASLAVFPYGSGNDFARTLQVSADFSQLKELLLENQPIAWDLGKMKYQDEAGNAAERWFNNIADVGIGGKVVKMVANGPKWLSPGMRYQMAIIRSLLNFGHLPLKLESDSLNYEGKAVSIVMANARFFGSGMGISPDANPRDGKMNLVLIGEVGLFEYLRYLPSLKKSRKIDHPEVAYATTDACRITPIGAVQVPIDMDGEFIGYAPIEVEMVPQAQKFFSRNRSF